MSSMNRKSTTTPLLKLLRMLCGRFRHSGSHIQLKSLLSWRYTVPSVGFEPTLYGF